MGRMMCTDNASYQHVDCKVSSPFVRPMVKQFSIVQITDWDTA